MKSTLLIYEDKHELTEKMIKNMALILGPARYCKVNEFKIQYKEFDFFVISLYIHEGSIDEEVKKFLTENSDWLKLKNIALFCTASSDISKDCFKELENLLGDSIVLEENFSVNKSDYKLEEIIKFAVKVKQIRDSCSKLMDREKLKPQIEKFLTSHNTCTLCTASSISVRGTPIEYTYKDGNIYFLTEGGEKFANILLNPEVSIAVYDSYESMSRLAGIQISGRAELVECYCSEYLGILKDKGINPEALKKYSIIMNMLKVKLDKAEFLYSGFKNTGEQSKQIYTFK